MLFVSGASRQPAKVPSSAGWVHVAAHRFVAIVELHGAKEPTFVQSLLEDATRTFEASGDVEKCFGPVHLTISARKSSDPALRGSLVCLSIEYRQLESRPTRPDGQRAD